MSQNDGRTDGSNLYTRRSFPISKECLTTITSLCSIHRSVFLTEADGPLCGTKWMFIYNVVYFSFRSVKMYPVLSSTLATRLASLMLIQAPRDNFLVATDTMTIIDTDMLHASALCSWKLHYFSLCTDTETDRLLCVCQKQTGYTLQHFVLGYSSYS